MPANPFSRVGFSAILILLGALNFPPLDAMTINLAGPYSAKPSRPRSSDITFIAPGHDDFLFRTGDTPQLVCHPYLRSLDLKWELSHNFVRVPLRTGSTAVRYDNSFALDLPLHELPPGFYDVRVKINLTATEIISAQTTVGWCVENLAIHAQRPDDFDAFWATALTHLDTLPPAPVCTLERTLRGPEIDAYNLSSASLPENYDPTGARADTVEVYRVHFASYGGKTIEGWFTKPAGPGPFPALLVLPGAGNSARPAPVEHARHGYAALDIQVHGNPVDASSYKSLPSDHASRPEEDTHYGIYLHALQAVRALKQLPGTDATRLAVLGGSQGGRLTVVVAALDPSIKAAIPAITHYAYMPWVQWTEYINNVKQSGGDTGFTGAPLSAAKQSDRYFDVLNFAPRIHCPVLMNVGLTDPVSGPTGVQAVYLSMPAAKEIVPLPNTGHDWSPAFDRHAWRWLNKVLGY